VRAGKKITPNKIRQEPNENESRRKAYEGRRRQWRPLIYKRESETETKIKNKKDSERSNRNKNRKYSTLTASAPD
jgi:hypothetical protein